MKLVVCHHYGKDYGRSPQIPGTGVSCDSDSLVSDKATNS